jgi:hypothetical protein
LLDFDWTRAFFADKLIDQSNSSKLPQGKFVTVVVFFKIQNSKFKIQNSVFVTATYGFFNGYLWLFFSLGEKFCQEKLEPLGFKNI